MIAIIEKLIKAVLEIGAQLVTTFVMGVILLIVAVGDYFFDRRK